MDQAVNFTFFIRFVRKYWRGILLWTIGGLLVAGGLAFYVVTPKYKASVQILVSRHAQDAATQYATQQADVQMITTYKELITNQVILKPAQEVLAAGSDYDGTLGLLKNEVSVTSNQNSQVFSIDVLDTNPQRGAKIANQIAQTFKDRVKDIIKVNNVTIVSTATPAKSAVSPRRLIYLAVGLLIGGLLGLFYASIRALTDRRIHSSYYLTNELKLNNLGQVNHQMKRLHVDKQLGQLRSKQTSNLNIHRTPKHI